MNIENNKIIAEFMNYAIIDKNGNHKDECYNYDCNWNWLMEVVEKVEKQGFDFAIYTGACVSIINTKDFPYEEIINLNGSSKIEAVYNACFEFIKWYNLKN